MGIQVWKKFDVMQLAVVSGAVSAIIGLIMGIIVALFASVAAPLMAMYGGVAVGFGIASIVIMPIAYGIMGFIGGAIGAVIYNFVAEKLGGVKVMV